MSQAEDDEVLKKFYRTVNPWGWWGPIREKVMRDDPSFVPNRSAVHDLTNVAVGIVWQLCLVTLPDLHRPEAVGRGPGRSSWCCSPPRPT
jgi:SSS family solute:Na+ symporter